MFKLTLPLMLTACGSSVLKSQTSTSSVQSMSINASQLFLVTTFNAPAVAIMENTNQNFMRLVQAETDKKVIGSFAFRKGLFPGNTTDFCMQINNAGNAVSLLSKFQSLDVSPFKLQTNIQYSCPF